MVKGNFKVEFRTHCLACGEKITEPRFRTYCSNKCRERATNQRYKKEHREWQQQARAKKATKNPRKVQCLVCGLWYVQVGSHIVQVHKITAREYREQYELPIKRGIVPAWYREMKGEQTIENKTFQNLKKGRKFWYKKGDPRAIINTGYKGQPGKLKKLSQDIYPH